MRDDNVKMLQDTLNILKRGYYVFNGERKNLKLTERQMKKCTVYLPDDVERIRKSKDAAHVRVMGRVGFGVENIDSFSLARKRYQDGRYLFSKKADPRILVLNLANPVNPGGGVRRGARAQEEDLCRKSSLLLSLEGEQAQSYYRYNRSLNTFMGSDGIILTPDVEIIKDGEGNLLEDSVLVSVMTCAAPMVVNGKEGLSEEQYRSMVYNRIEGMLKVAAFLKYEVLVLGAFGCGAFGNDARVVSDLFYKALKEFDFDGMKAEDFFRRIDFAVLCRPDHLYNYEEFSRNFKDFYREENKKETENAVRKAKAAEIHLDRIRGSLIGGAVGDALGYAVEFFSENRIFAQYGPEGITEYNLTNGEALISDDTQMTLFTANGLLVGDTRGSMRGIMGAPHAYVAYAYRDWYLTQTVPFDILKGQQRFTKEGGRSWLLDVPELFARRAPGNTCLSALSSDKEPVTDYIKNPVNDSKGCGGIMRVAPIALKYRIGENFYGSRADIDKEGAQIAAITHGHSLGYMPAAVVTHIINRCLTDRGVSLKEIVVDAKDTAASLFAGDPHLPELTAIIDLAIGLSENDCPDLDNIHRLGEGWVAEETLGIAIYCALKYRDDFSKAIITAVNHNGDSDSTGAVTGNILGALIGYDAIEAKWKKNLELHDVILEIADDLCRGCVMSEYSHYYDPAWAAKYMSMHRYLTEREKTSPEKKYTFFWKDDGENGCFSNWYRRDFVIDDFKYFCVEQYMMAQKAKLFHDAGRYTAILRAKTPADCKALGKQVTPYDDGKWAEARYEIVKKANRAKFEQNRDLLSLLLDTGNSILAEASPKDTVWGIGLEADDAMITEPRNWPGQNLLGKILMELRTEFGGDANRIVSSPELDTVNRVLRDGLV